MSRIKLWVGIGAFVLAQTGQVALTPDGLDLSLGASPALAGERGEGEGEGEGEDGEQGEQGERGEGERGEGERGGRGDSNRRRDAPLSDPTRTIPPEGGR